jgi:hypothetical protein
MTPEELAARLDPSRMRGLRERLMTRIVITVEGAAKVRAPVRTGTLRRSITHAVEAAGERGVVGTSVSYAPFVHRRRPFLTEGLAASRDSIQAELAAFGMAFLGGDG